MTAKHRLYSESPVPPHTRCHPGPEPGSITRFFRCRQRFVPGQDTSRWIPAQGRDDSRWVWRRQNSGDKRTNPRPLRAAPYSIPFPRMERRCSDRMAVGPAGTGKVVLPVGSSGVGQFSPCRFGGCATRAESVNPGCPEAVVASFSTPPEAIIASGPALPTPTPTGPPGGAFARTKKPGPQGPGT